MSNEEIYESAIRTFGSYEQERICVEECAELIQAISHKHRGRRHNISEEIADVEICIAQLKLINECADEVERIREYKLQRLYYRICDNCF